MTYSLLGTSILFFLIGIFMFFKKKALIGWFFIILGLTGILLWIAVVAVFPDKL